MKKALFVATVFKFFNFEKSDMAILKKMGYEIHTASNMNSEEWLKADDSLDDICPINHQIDFGRTPFSKNSIIAYKQLKSLLELEDFDLLHCHTPVGAAIARLAAIGLRKKGLKVIYTDHGFHFHKSSGIKNWLVYFSVEFLLSFFTDMIITINKEDFEVIKKFPKPLKRYIPGVGVDINGISQKSVNVDVCRKKYGIPNTSFLLISIGELSIRKNQSVIIRALSLINNPNIYYIICGTGVEEENLRKLAKDCGIEKNVIFTGFLSHEEVIELAHCSNLGVLPSLIEGLGLAGIEVMASGKPVVASGIHGIVDYVIDGETGIRCNPHSASDFANAINTLYNHRSLYKRCCEGALLKSKDFNITNVRELMVCYYKELLHF